MGWLGAGRHGVGALVTEPAPRKAIILDRDGTLIDVVRDEETSAIGVAFHPDQLRILPGVEAGLAAFVAAGYVLAIATNQPGPAKGQFSAKAVARTNEALVELLAARGIPIAMVAACLHHPTGGPGGDASLVGPCACRKPQPGMLEEIIAKLAIDRAGSWMIGDSRGDHEAGRAAKLRTALVFSTERCELCPLRGGPAGAPDIALPTLEEIAARVCGARPMDPR